MEPTEPAAGRCVGQLVISVALTAMALVTSPDRRFLQPRRSGRLRDPRLASFVRWDTIGASRVRPLDVSSPQAPARPGLSLLSVYRRARQGGKCGVGQLVTTGRQCGPPTSAFWRKHPSQLICELTR